MRTPAARSSVNFNRLVIGSFVTTIAAITVASAFSSGDEASRNMWRHLFELGGLVVTLAVATPFNASRLYQLPDAEGAIVLLEWMKAYIGRIIGPLTAVVVYTHLGYGALLGLLSLMTAIVTVT